MMRAERDTANKRITRFKNKETHIVRMFPFVEDGLIASSASSLFRSLLRHNVACDVKFRVDVDRAVGDIRASKA